LLAPSRADHSETALIVAIRKYFPLENSFPLTRPGMPIYKNQYM
jgi:hypothetical protein